MSENTKRPGCSFKEAVCIDAMRIFDSCSSQDCLEDVQFCFEPDVQMLINNAAYIKTTSIDVTDVDFSISPVAFNQGFYSVDVTYNFRAQIEVFSGENEPPTVVFGRACFTKKVILYGSDGGTQRFDSDTGMQTVQESQTTGCACCCRSSCTLPTASVSLVEPMCLDTKLKKRHHHHHEHSSPCDKCSKNNGNDSGVMGDKEVLITIGIFAVISLSRPVPVMVPIYDYCLPGKECVSNSTSPCEMFEQIEFPRNEFFPRGLEESCGCNLEDSEENDE